MKVAIQNPFAGQLVAETELSRRLCLAASHLGWDTAEVQTAAQIKAYQPDFVIALHNNSPKLTEYPTYGCMWNPPSFFEGTEKYVQHVLSYDGYLTSGGAIDRWLHHLLYTTPKVFLTAPFYTSCPQNPYQPPHLENPQLVYLGSNWDGPRFQELFQQLDQQAYLRVYGNPDGWKYLHHAYQRPLPYDGASVLQTLNQAGVGLCLHRSEHRQAGLPSMRIFEIVASGAIALCGEHPFIRAAFGNSVLYLDPDAPVTEQVQQISSHMQWIKQHPEAAVAMSAKAHQIFLDHYALEKLLSDLLVRHQAFIQQPSGSLTPVQILLRYCPEAPDDLIHALDSIAQQTYANCSALVVKPPQASLDAILPQPKHSIQVVESAAPFASSSLWAGLRAIDSEYFAILNAADALHPNHIQTLVDLLDRHPNVGAVYSGGLDRSSPERLVCFQPFNLDPLLTLQLAIPLSGMLIRRSLLDAILLQDPQLNAYEDICLVWHLAQRTSLLFSYAVTYETDAASDRLWQTSQEWSSELSRLKFIFWHQEFAPGKTLQSVQQNHRDQMQLKARVEQGRSQAQQNQALQAQLQSTQAKLEAMKTSKFWQLRSAWFKAKRAIGLSTADE